MENAVAVTDLNSGLQSEILARMMFFKKAVVKGVKFRKFRIEVSCSVGLAEIGTSYDEPVPISSF
jgi:hypothetical protein